jgi:hypothetical protein
MATTKTIAPILPVGTIVSRQARGQRRIQNQARILEAFTKSDKLGRRQIVYRVQILESGVVREWPGPHCVVFNPAPASA